MTSPKPLLILLLVLVVALALGVAFLGGGENGTGGEDEDGGLLPTPGNGPTDSARGFEGEVRLVPPPEVIFNPEALAVTTVLWPVKVQLDLLHADYLPTARGVPKIGSGATARLSGRIGGKNDQGARATIRFLAGPNAGRELFTDATGRFGAADLYPGLAIVDVRGAGLLGSRREVRLRGGNLTQLHIGYGRPGGLEGLVIDAKGEPLEGAEVVVDGTRYVTGIDGGFYASSVAAGQVLVEVKANGYAAHKELVPITGGKVLPSEQATFALKEGASLTLTVPDNIGGPGPVQVVILPSRIERPGTITGVQRNTGFPWHVVNPVEVWPGTTEKVEGLPAGVVQVYSFRPGASIPQRVVTLRAGRTTDVVLPLSPAPKVVGRVFRDGKPVAGARVRLEAPDQTKASLKFFKEQTYFLESAVMPTMPAAQQEVETTVEGRFTLTAWDQVAGVRYLEAVSPDGKYWAGRLVKAGEEVIDLNLEEVEIAGASLVLDFPGRWQALPVEVQIHGKPFAPVAIPAGDELPITGLRDGKWRLSITWNGETILIEDGLAIQGTTKLELDLPPGAIEGQDEEQWSRAGRDYPR